MALTIIPIEVWKVIALFLCDRWVIHTFSQTCKSFRYLRRYGCILPPQWRVCEKTNRLRRCVVKYDQFPLSLAVVGMDGVERTIATWDSPQNIYCAQPAYQYVVVERFRVEMDIELYLVPYDASSHQVITIPYEHPLMFCYQYFQGRIMAYNHDTQAVKFYNLDGTVSFATQMPSVCGKRTKIYALKNICALIDVEFDTIYVIVNDEWHQMHIEELGRYKLERVVFAYSLITDSVYIQVMESKNKYIYALVHFYDTRDGWRAKAFFQSHDSWWPPCYEFPDKVYHRCKCDDLAYELTLPRVLQLE